MELPRTARLKLPLFQIRTSPYSYGLNSMERNRTILDLTNGVAYMCGPGSFDLATALPAGTKKIKLCKNKAGHIVTPCAKFNKVSKPVGINEPQLALPTETKPCKMTAGRGGP